MCSVAAGQTLADSADRDTDIDEILRDVLKMSDFRGNQRAVILAALRGRDTVVLMATGSGKSLCFQLPAMCTTGSTVVIGPLSVLMDDQMHELQARGISCAKYDSSVEQEGRAALLRQLGSTLKILYTTPEQLSESSTLRTRLVQLSQICSRHKSHAQRLTAANAHALANR